MFKKIFKSKWLKWIAVLFASFVFILFVANFISPLKTDVDYSQIILSNDGTVLYSFLTKNDKWRMFTEQNEISQRLKEAILFKEDKYFYYHFGVNPFAIVRAAINNIFHLKRTSGASTISMQVVRLLYPNERTYLNKFMEMFRATQLELKFSKEEILQLYFNIVPYGGNIEGIKAASLLYFDRQPDKLSLAQIISLAIIPNRPESLRFGKNNETIVQNRNKWLMRMKRAHLFPEKEIDDAISEPLDATRGRIPRSAPHFSIRMHHLFPGIPIVKTTIDKNKEQKISALAYNYVKRLKSFNINNAAVLVINNKTHAVETYVGSQDFFDDVNSGQVDGVAALRSPGSTLKPLIYALAFDKGLLTPKSVIIDAPVNFDGYAPDNFNGRFNGNVTTEKALSYSLNVPAVKTLNQLGVATVTDKLKQAGFEQMQNEKRFGLSLALGGCGVKLEELGGLYSSFSNEGKFSPLKYLLNDTSTINAQIVSPASAYMISEILSTLTRPDLPVSFESTTHVPKVAWKTGTSYGRRDAWSIGYNKNYTVGVWIGNFTGEGVPELTGADMASPLLFEIFNAIDYNTANNWFTIPADLDYRLVCPETGKIPGEFCSHPVIDYFIPKVSSIEQCAHQKKIFTTADEKFSYCMSCLPPSGYKEKIYPNFPPELISYFESENISYKKIPPHNPNCTRVFTELAPKIISPVGNKEYILEKGDGKIQLSCHADNEVKTIYWYINDRLYRSCSASEKVFFEPEAGITKISCSDDKGRNSNESIKVKFF